MRVRVLVSLLAALLISVAAVAQQAGVAIDPYAEPSATAAQTEQPIQTEPMAQTPVYHVNVVERVAKAVDYRDHLGSTTTGVLSYSVYHSWREQPFSPATPFASRPTLPRPHSGGRPTSSVVANPVMCFRPIAPG